MIVIKTIYMPRGSKGTVFAVDGNGKFFKLLRNGKDWSGCAKSEFDDYKTNSEDSWFNPVSGNFGSWLDVKRAIDEVRN